MTDPLGSGVYSGALTDVQTLVTTSYVPGLITAILAAVAIGIGLTWLRRGVCTFKRPG